MISGKKPERAGPESTGTTGVAVNTRDGGSGQRWGEGSSKRGPRKTHQNQSFRERKKSNPDRRAQAKAGRMNHEAFRHVGSWWHLERGGQESLRESHQHPLNVGAAS